MSCDTREAVLRYTKGFEVVLCEFPCSVWFRAILVDETGFWNDWAMPQFSLAKKLVLISPDAWEAVLSLMKGLRVSFYGFYLSVWFRGILVRHTGFWDRGYTKDCFFCVNGCKQVLDASEAVLRRMEGFEVLSCEFYCSVRFRGILGRLTGF